MLIFNFKKIRPLHRYLVHVTAHKIDPAVFKAGVMPLFGQIYPVALDAILDNRIAVELRLKCFAQAEFANDILLIYVSDLELIASREPGSKIAIENGDSGAPHLIDRLRCDLQHDRRRNVIGISVIVVIVAGMAALTGSRFHQGTAAPFRAECIASDEKHRHGHDQRNKDR